jgi:hypothetical protein
MKIINDACFISLGGYAFNSSTKPPKSLKAAYYTGMIAGYIPVVGTVVGIARIAIFTSLIFTDNKDGKYTKIYLSQIARGVFETASLGFLLIAPDIIFTIGRGINQKEASIASLFIGMP